MGRTASHPVCDIGDTGQWDCGGASWGSQSLRSSVISQPRLHPGKPLALSRIWPDRGMQETRARAGQGGAGVGGGGLSLHHADPRNVPSFPTLGTDCTAPGCRRARFWPSSSLQPEAHPWLEPGTEALHWESSPQRADPKFTCKWFASVSQCFNKETTYREQLSQHTHTHLAPAQVLRPPCSPLTVVTQAQPVLTSPEGSGLHPADTSSSLCSPRQEARCHPVQ